MIYKLDCRMRTSDFSLAATTWVLSLTSTIWYCLLPLLFSLRKMLSICDVYAAEYSVFNAQKSKCLLILSNVFRYLRPLLQENVFYVDGKQIDFVSSFPHLGYVSPTRWTMALTLQKGLGIVLSVLVSNVCKL